MRQKVFWLTVLLTAGVGALLSAVLSTSAGSASETNKRAARGKPSPIAQGPVTVTVTPVGPSQAEIDAALRTVNADPMVRKYLADNRVRQLAFDVLDRPRLALRDPYRVTFYDYTNNRSILVNGSFGDSRGISVTLGNVQPLPSPDEFDAAVEVLKADKIFGPGLEKGRIKTYRPMPPLASDSAAVERALHVGLFDSREYPPNQIVAVNLIRTTVSTYEKNAPPIAVAEQALCGVPGAGQSTTPRGTAGQYNLVVTQAGQEVWRMLIVRPSASSGTRASAIELRDVFYRGKSVFKRAHAPIMNVQYDRNLCGPYRDWQWQEGQFSATGSDVAPGVRLTSTPPQTIMESFADAGNFRGVAIYQDPATGEVQLLSELEAGWYRYISRWEFAPDGRIRARFGFDGVNNSCVCNVHHHHIYWRFDFDLASAGRNRFVEYDTRSFNAPILTEVKRYRDYLRDRYWSIENIVSGEMIKIEPGHDDGTADVYARGDAWFLRYRATELDDGVNTTGPNNTEAKLDDFVNGESLDGQDVVMWYAGHNDHIFDGAPGGHLIGPDLIVVRW